MEYTERNERNSEFIREGMYIVMKNAVKQLLIMTGVLFVLMLMIDTIIIRVIDKHEENDTFVVNIAERTLQNMDEVEETADVVEYSEILGRNLTKEEEKEQRKLEAQRSLLIYNNIGLAEDFLLPDGTWLLDEDMIYIDLSVQTEDGTNYYNVFPLDDTELLEKYRSYWEDSFYSYDKNTKVAVERYRYYQLVFDRFYLDGMTVLPEQVSIYRVERMPIGDEEYPEITGCELMETLQFEVLDKEGLPCYELAMPLDENTVGDVSYDYTCNGVEGYRVMRDCTLNGKFFSLEERKKLLQECLDETYKSRDRDLVGFSNYYYRKSTKDSDLLGGEVTILLCEQNIFYNMWQYAWKLVVLVVVLEAVVSLGIAAMIIAIRISKQKKA